MKPFANQKSGNLYQQQKAFALCAVVSYHLAFSKACMHL
jgi:hypothetical protein